VKDKTRVLVAGIGGASLGTEILKCLVKANRYAIFGCDISSLAFGHYQSGFERTFLIDRKTYVESIIDICKQTEIELIIPGGEEPAVLLSAAKDILRRAGLHLAGNSAQVVKRFSDKEATFKALAELGFEVPITVAATKPRDLDDMRYPCVVKPATGSGGSSFVFLAEDQDEALLYVGYLTKNGRTALVQEYVSEEEGEFTIGILSLTNRQIVGSVALKRIFDSKLSVLLKSKAGLISSGYSQGLIDDFGEIRATAERIAVSIESEGPVNIQGRVRNGTLLPFEINPRFSASTYLRALAGFNEVDIYLQHVLGNALPEPLPLREGYYLRSFDEVCVRRDKVIS
jgi:carbamoyl-phosphate synthase large subunit